MTTDDKEIKSNEQIVDEKTTSEDIKIDISETKPETELSPSEKLVIDKMMESFNNKLSETMDKYDKKIDELNKSITEKDKEIAKLRKVNSEILMSTDLRGNKKDDIDFNDVEFNEVDWDKEARGLLSKIDKKLS
mgnify:CR=1 FL=1